MIPENDKYILNILAASLHNESVCPVPEGKWAEIYKELRTQAVNLVPSDCIYQLGLSENEQLTYLKEIAKSRSDFRKLLTEQKKILELLNESGIPVVILKGSSAAINYPHPENRCMGDIDLLVLPDDFEKAYGVLSEAGYKTKQNPEIYNRHIGFESDSGVHIELHHHFSSSHNKDQNLVFDQLLYDAIPQRTDAEINGFPAVMLPPAENGLVLLGHINQHMSGGIGLRHLVDWTCYAEKYLSGKFWESTFSGLTEQIGMKRLAQVVTATCIKYLGLKLPDFNAADNTSGINWCSYEPVCDELMEYVLSRGNFGIKIAPKKSKTTAVIKLIRHPVRGFKTAQFCGMNNWSAAGKHKILRPFAWIYQLGRWANHGIKYGVGISTISGANQAAKENSEFMKKIGVTRT